MRDVAFLKVAALYIGGAFHRVQQITGGNALKVSPVSMEAISVPAYPAGVGGHPVLCTARGYRTGPYLSFNCNGYAAGSSGAPFLQGSTVVGVIGGLHQGGCFSYTSYSAPFDSGTLHTLDRAVEGSQPDILPPAGPDGC